MGCGGGVTAAAVRRVTAGSSRQRLTITSSGKRIVLGQREPEEESCPRSQGSSQRGVHPRRPADGQGLSRTTTGPRSTGWETSCLRPTSLSAGSTNGSSGRETPLSKRPDSRRRECCDALTDRLRDRGAAFSGHRKRLFDEALEKLTEIYSALVPDETARARSTSPRGSERGSTEDEPNSLRRGPATEPARRAGSRNDTRRTPPRRDSLLGRTGETPGRTRPRDNRERSRWRGSSLRSR